MGIPGAIFKGFLCKDNQFVDSHGSVMGDGEVLPVLDWVKGEVVGHSGIVTRLDRIVVNGIDRPGVQMKHCRNTMPHESSRSRAAESLNFIVLPLT